MMTSSSADLLSTEPAVGAIQRHLDGVIDDLLSSLPAPERLSAEQRRAVIARYTAVLEGNFIYWMTGAWLAVKSDAARAKIMENLHEEVRDAHPLMMRRFATAARAVPTEIDVLAVQKNLTAVRLFIGRLSAVRIIVTMAFFEGLIQRFMPYLAELARLQGSELQAEMTLATDPAAAAENLFEGVELLHALIVDIVAGSSAPRRSIRRLQLEGV